MSFLSKCLDTEIIIVELKTRNEKNLSRPRILCDVRGHLRQQTLVYYLVSSFKNFFARCFGSTGVLCFPSTVCAA